jgi:hypothetical protein
MQQAVFSKEKLATLAGTLSAVAAVALLPLIKQQAVTGTLVNTVLFLAVVWLGFRNALWVCFIPSIFALSSGLLPAILAPFIPFIILSNAVLIGIFEVLRKKNFWLGIVSASFLKFTFLFLTGRLLISFLPERRLVQVISSMMTWPQLFTALFGGIITYIIVRSVPSLNSRSSGRE